LSKLGKTNAKPVVEVKKSDDSAALILQIKELQAQLDSTRSQLDQKKGELEVAHQTLA
jgi:hypothetical protein